MQRFRYYWNANLLNLQFVRNAGHSKWQNIRHIKQENDAVRSQNNAQLLRKLKVSVLENGGETDPKRNKSLANILEDITRSKIPKDVWTRHLKKLQDGEEVKHEVVLRGPNNYILNASFYTLALDRNYLRQLVKQKVRKTKFQFAEDFKNAFVSKGIIIAKPPSDETTADDAEEAAILSGAEEMLPIEEENEKEKFFQFTTDAYDLWTVGEYLKKNNWEIIQQETELLPTFLVQLSDLQKEEIKKDLELIATIPGFEKIVDNMEQSV